MFFLIKIYACISRVRSLDNKVKTIQTKFWESCAITCSNLLLTCPLLFNDIVSHVWTLPHPLIQAIIRIRLTLTLTLTSLGACWPGMGISLLPECPSELFWWENLKDDSLTGRIHFVLLCVITCLTFCDLVRTNSLACVGLRSSIVYYCTYKK